MTKPDDTHDEKRRAFLLGAGMAAGAGIVTTGLVPEAAAQKAQAKRGAEPHAGHSPPPVRGYGAFLNDENADAVDAITERIMPGGPGMPGARECGVLNYIDLALSGPYEDLREFYREGLLALEAYCQKTYKRSFARLTAAQQDEALKALEEGKATEFTWPRSQAFFNTLRTHTMEGMFADPVYGGNRNFAGWRLIGFPGAQPTYSPQDMASPRPFTRERAVGLQGQAAPLRSTKRS